MLACTALVGCTDEALENDGNGQQEATKYGNAYISLAITPSTNSSRAAGNNAGDEDGYAEDSGHHNVGTTQESAIKEVLVILTAGVKSTDATKPNGVIEYFTTPATDFTTTGDVRKLNKVYRMGVIGNYKAMVVMNPVPDLKTSLASFVENQDHQGAYNKILESKLTSASYTAEDDNKTYFMMTNKKEIEITVGPEHNSESTPAGLENEDIIEVERTISKITYRWKEALTKDSKGEAVNSAITALGANVYEIAVTGNAYQSVTERMWFEDDNQNMKYAIFNKATLNGTEYWILFKDGTGGLVLNGGQFYADDIYGVYTKTTTKSKGYIGTENAANVDADAEYADGYVTDYVATKVTTITDLTQLELVRGTSTPITDQYFVKLEKYRLTNLSREVYAVRHIADIDYNAKTFGALGVQDYLVDPYTSAKNQWTTGITNTAWFTSPYLTVMQNKQSLEGATGLPEGLDTDEEADGSGSQSITDTQHNNQNTGAYLTYCFENAVAADKQVFDLVTGIVFQGQMYDKNGNKISKAYSYSTDGGYTKTIYRTLRELLDNNPSITSITENTPDSEIDVEGLEIYEEGKCFYYTAGIKHFDNYQEGETGVMEYAIMRNNIYSLSIESIKGIGMSTLTPQSGQLVEDQSAYITMQAKIVPWIVRFNDIEF